MQAFEKSISEDTEKEEPEKQKKNPEKGTPLREARGRKLPSGRRAGSTLTSGLSSAPPSLRSFASLSPTFRDWLSNRFPQTPSDSCPPHPPVHTWPNPRRLPPGASSTQPEETTQPAQRVSPNQGNHTSPNGRAPEPSAALARSLSAGDSRTVSFQASHSAPHLPSC